MEAPKHQKRPLLLAVRDGRLEEVKTLLASIDLSDEEKFNFLFYAIFYNQSEITKYMLENGFEQYLNQHKRSKQLYGVAGQNSIQCETVEIVEMLLKYGVDFANFSADALLEAAAKKGNLRFIKSLAYRVKDRDQARLLKKTLICTSFKELQPQIFQLLLEYGSSALTADEFCVLLYQAHSRGNRAAIRSLFCRASDFNLEELLKVAVTKTTGWLPKILQLLLEYGSSDLYFVNDPNVFKPLFETLNKPHPYFLNYHRSCAIILVNHIMKLKVAKLYNSKEEFSATIYNNQPRIADYRQQCEAELESLMNETVGNTHITFYDILTRPIKLMAKLARNETIVELMKSEAYRVKFPIYHGLVYNQFEKGIIRKELIDKGIKIYRSLLKNFSALPHDIMEIIVSFSSNKDLRSLIITIESSSSPQNVDVPSGSQHKNLRRSRRRNKNQEKDGASSSKKTRRQ
ncbi:unnamed protein product [Bemisia tabaci]|uniref:PRANC domain-containing protein n=1 Tax=Bemisia tabaci TaxID=7038 RepID=A0A9P0ANN7_BEMTA|nr:unnamed protein product [Bemisia tabaci]